MNESAVRLGILAVIIVVALGLRLVGLGTFMTADEPNWMIRSSQAWHELTRGNPGGTFITSHPGATAMWLIGAGEMVQEKRIGLAPDTSTLSHFRLAATLPMAIATSLLVGLITYFVMHLWGMWPGAAAGFLLAVEPYLVGMSQVAHLDALLAFSLVAAVCAFLVAVKKQSLWFMITAGMMAGLAAGTKLLPSLIFLPWVALVSWVVANGSWRSRVAAAVRHMGIVMGMVALTFFAVWPALWVKNDLGRYLGRDAVTVATVSHADMVEEGRADLAAAASFYVRTVAGRTTPFVLILVIGALVVLVRAMKVSGTFISARLSVVWLIVFALAFLVMVTLVAKKSDRYALPALATLPLIAGWAGAGVWQMAQDRQWRWPHFQPSPRLWPALRFLASRGVAAVLAVLLVVQAILWMPYAIAYNSPLFAGRPLSQQGWGEGLDEAAGWLNEHPLKEKLTVASWYPNVLATYFSGTTFSLSSRNDPRVGYVVLYRNMLGRGPDEAATNVWDEYRERTPVKTIAIGGRAYVWIFETFGVPYFPKHIGELLPGAEVGQLVPIERDGWNRIDVGLSTFSGRAKDADVILHVRESVDASSDIRTIRKAASEVADSDWNTFAFEPIADSAGKTYYVALTTATGKAGDALTVRYTDDDIKAGQMFWHRLGGRRPAEAVAKAGDIAYRLND